MTTRAYAKINLGLRILRKREDGYHDIETVLHRINVFDELRFEQSPTVSLSWNGHDLPNDDTNLCVRAAALLRREFKIQHGVRITLTKNIPVGAGLGGGSSDAAAVLTTLPSFWNQSPAATELRSLALELGSDVPYFLQRGTAYATGRGEILDYFDLDLPYWVVVIYPNVRVSTTWAYRNLQLNTPRGASRIPNPPASSRDILLEHMNEPRMLMGLLRNDFEPLVLRAYPEVAKTKKKLYDGGAVFAQMSGSGSSVYGLFESEPALQNIVEKQQKQFPVFVTPPHFHAEARSD